MGLGLRLIGLGGCKSQEDHVLELLREKPEATRDEVRRQMVRMNTPERDSRMIDAQKSLFHTLSIPGVPDYMEMMMLSTSYSEAVLYTCGGSDDVSQDSAVVDGSQCLLPRNASVTLAQ